MGPITLLLIGVLIVVAGIIALRWHPFIALTAAGLTVAALTPADLLYRSKLDAGQRAALVGEGSGGIPMAAPAGMEKAHDSALAYAGKWFVARFTEAFGKGCGEIALVIAMAAIIGQRLHSGGAKRIVDSLMRLFGARGTPFAFAGSAFTLGIPVFFDTVFYLLMPLGKALRRETGRITCSTFSRSWPVRRWPIRLCRRRRGRSRWRDTSAIRCRSDR